MHVIEKRHALIRGYYEILGHYQLRDRVSVSHEKLGNNKGIFLVCLCLPWGKLRETGDRQLADDNCVDSFRSQEVKEYW